MIVFHQNNPIEFLNEEDFERFALNFRQIHAAGGLVRNEYNEILMIYRWEKWDFPKGKVEEGEHNEEAALREVQEETGIQTLKLGRVLPKTYHTYELHGSPILKVTHWYAMEAPKQPLTPQTMEDISQAVWIPFDEVTAKLSNSYPSLEQLWTEAKLDN